MRIDKLLSQLKYGSRKVIHQAIKEGKVQVDQRVIDSKDTQVNPKQQTIVFAGETVVYFSRVVLMFHKPKGVICAHKDDRYPTVFEFIKDPFNRYDLNVAGRLDVDAEGLVILTDDGALLHEIISPKKKIYKTYHVWTENPLLDPQALLQPMRIKDGKNQWYTPLKPLSVKVLEPRCTEIKICEGKFHQVKRMFEAIGHPVVRLKRTAIHRLQLDVPVGEYRSLSDLEISNLMR